MKRRMKINETAKILYIPQEVIDEGYKGDIDVLMNARTITIIKPGATLEEVRRSLEIVLQDVKLRMDSENREAQESDKKTE